MQISWFSQNAKLWVKCPCLTNHVYNEYIYEISWSTIGAPVPSFEISIPGISIQNFPVLILKIWPNSFCDYLSWFWQKPIVNEFKAAQLVQYEFTCEVFADILILLIVVCLYILICIALWRLFLTPKVWHSCIMWNRLRLLRYSSKGMNLLTLPHYSDVTPFVLLFYTMVPDEKFTRSM